MNNFSQKYFGDNLTKKEHKENNSAFKELIKDLDPDNLEHLYVTGVGLWFDHNGEEVKYEVVCERLGV